MLRRGSRRLGAGRAAARCARITRELSPRGLRHAESSGGGESGPAEDALSGASAAVSRMESRAVSRRSRRLSPAAATLSIAVALLAWQCSDAAKVDGWPAMALGRILLQIEHTPSLEAAPSTPSQKLTTGDGPSEKATTGDEKASNRLSSCSRASKNKQLFNVPRLCYQCFRDSQVLLRRCRQSRPWPDWIGRPRRLLAR